MLTRTTEKEDNLQHLSDDKASPKSQQNLLKQENNEHSLSMEEPIYNHNNYSQQNSIVDPIVKTANTLI
ncbi:MAG: hypothetical protein GY821_16575 [Gammaproteobacteria bacterium]|nr:hypothetical protein [Gammaproteobacteria bacterium]